MKTLCILSLTFMMVYTAHINHSHNRNLKPVINEINLKDEIGKEVDIIKSHNYSELLDGLVYTRKEELAKSCVDKFFCLAEKSLATFPPHSSLNNNSEVTRLHDLLKNFHKIVEPKCTCEPIAHTHSHKLRNLLTHISECVKVDTAKCVK